jgi:hypothetical protein
MDSCKSIKWALLLTAVALLDDSHAFSRALDKIKLDGHDTHDIELFIEQKIQFIHAKIDLKPTIMGLLSLEKCVLRLDRGSSDSLGLSLTKHLNKRLDRIINKLKRVSGKSYINSRDKRAIETIGNLISDIFGNPGPADWKKVNANILALQKAIRRASDNISENHKDIDMTRNAVESHNNILKTLSAAITREQNDLTNVSKELDSLRMFFEISTLADTIEHQIDNLVEIKTDSVKGYCSDRAINKDFLIENLQNLESNKAGIGPVYGSWEWREYYRYEFCSTAMDNDAVWVSLRIPLVRKSEKLVRVIPGLVIYEVLSHVASYSLNTVLLREKENDKFHIITQASLDLCNQLGNVRTCGVRDVRFGSNVPLIVPVEFARNKLLLVSTSNYTVKMMAKCPEGISEHTITTDAVLTVPNNCSYTSSSFSIDSGEADVEITKELGIIQIDHLEISAVSNFNHNMSVSKIENIASRVNNQLFEKNKKEIDMLLESIDTKHEGLSSSYGREKWIFVEGVCTLVACYVIIKIIKRLRRKKSDRGSGNKIELKVFNNSQEQTERQQGKQQRQQHQQQQHMTTNMTTKKTDDNQDDNRDNILTEQTRGTDNDNQEVHNFGLPLDQLQFYSK